MRRLSGFALILPSDDIGESKPRHVDGVICNRKHSAPADLHLRSGQFELVLQPREQLTHEPAWNLLALGGVNEPEVQKVNQQDFPVLFHRAKQTLPINLLMLHQYEM